ncbi:MAG: hypothetical protein HY696_06310 [Deltaproteobacteria bacterium]|nr:hypothetical protein [Deltaproteobacteria bacterium]
MISLPLRTLVAYAQLPAPRDPCLDHGVRIEDDQPPPQFHGDRDANTRGLQLRIEEPAALAGLCPLDTDRNGVINAQDFRATIDDTARDRMITSVAATLAQVYGNAVATPQFAEGVKELFALYPQLHATDETLLTLKLHATDEAVFTLTPAPKSNWHNRLVPTRAAVQRVFYQPRKMHLPATTTFQANLLGQAKLESLARRIDRMVRSLYFDGRQIPLVYGGISYFSLQQPAALERAVDRVRVRWMRTISQLRQFYDIGCGDKDCYPPLSFAWLQQHHQPHIGVLEPALGPVLWLTWPPAWLPTPR